MTEVELQIKKARLKLAQKKKAEQDALVNSKIGGVDKKADYAIETSKEAKTIAEGSVELSNKALEVAKTTSKLKGEKGDRGEPGKDGYTPIKGRDYFDGEDGKDGKDGESIVGPRGPRGLKGEDGKSIKGDKGEPGKDGSPDTKYEIRDKLADLKGNERLDAKHIKNIDKQIKMSITTSGGSSGGGDTNTDEKVKVDAEDIAGYLEDKLQAGTNISFSEVAGKKIRINATAGGGGTVNTVVAGTDIAVDSTDPANPVVSFDGTIPTDTGDLTNGAGFITEETDPVFTSWDKDYDDLTNTPTIPTALADLSDDSTHRVVTDTEKSTWNAKSDFDGAYSSLSGTPTLGTAAAEDVGAFAPALGEDDNYVTDAQLTVISNTSGTNTGDQDISNMVETTDSINVLADVDTSTTAPSRDQVLKWNGTDWIPANYDTSFAMTIASFSDNQSSPQLIGSGTWKTAGNISFTASYNNPSPDSASIALSGTGMSGGFPITLSAPYTSGSNTASTSYPSAKDVTATFTLTAYDGATPRTSTQTVLFRNYLRWGVLSKKSGITSSDLLTLSGSELTNDQTQSKSINAGSGQYLVWAYPSSYTSLNASGLIFNSVTCPFESVATVSHTNEAGFTENYKVYASTNANLGNSTLTTSTSSTIINRLYYGITSKTGTFLESDVEGLTNSTVSNDNTQAWSSVTAGSGEYLLFAFPTRLGIPSFYVGGFSGGFESPETVSVTNVNGYTENYYVWRSTNSNLGATSVVTQ